MSKERVGITFAQAEDVEAMPSQLALREISPELSAVLWAVVHEMLDEALTHSGVYGGSYYFKNPWKTILRLWWVLRLHKNIDELPSPHALLGMVKEQMVSRNYIKVFDFLQFVMNRKECPHGFSETIDALLSNHRASYRVIEKHIVPIASDEQAQAVKADLEIAKRAIARGPSTHLCAASGALSAGQWAQSVRESIHAVEASAKSIEPTATTLRPALERLSTTIGLHPALSRAYNALYGYSSDEKGIRHALVLNGAANVSERDAIFMFGACAAFVGYLLSAARDDTLANK